MIRGVFVTGTDTGIGKTVTCAALMHRYRGESRVRYWKPIQTGSEQDNDTAEVKQLGECSDEEILNSGIRLERPVSPHLAARCAGTRIDLLELHNLLPSDSSARWILEGAGGVLVPINESETMADWMLRLNLPVLIVARTTLGTINHTLLTIEALRARSLKIAGVVMNGDPNSENRAAIEYYGCVPVIGEMPRFDSLISTRLGEWARASLDPDSILREFFA